MTTQTSSKIGAVSPKNLVEEMKISYLDYSMSVLVGRALPDVRDGLKPVHRRVLYTMHQSGLTHSKPYRKSANVVGNCMAKYHPHGDSAIYDTLVRMAQNFSMRYPLVDGQGNFGSVDGDNAAAMRYTEARLSKMAEELLFDIEKETVNFVPNFDGSAQEPVVLPARIPNLLINGSSGIAVGMATNIPPHNIMEVTNAAIHLIKNPNSTIEDILPLLKGPDFPTGGTILGTKGIRESYEKGRGTLRIRSEISRETAKDKTSLIVTQIPYQVNKSQLIEEIADLVKDKQILGISDIRDESDRDGMRIVIELKRDAPADVIENQLLSRTRLETTFGVSLVALIGGQPRTVTLMEILSEFIKHRQEVIRRRTAFELKKAQERLHILEGLLTALNRLDFVIENIRGSTNAEEAKKMLMRELNLSEAQSQAILDLRLQRLAALEQEKIRAEHTSTTEIIKELQSILASAEKISKIIVNELSEIQKNFGDARKTSIKNVDEDEEFNEESLIKEEPVAVTITRAGYIKRLSLDTYRQQNRGGKGVIATETREEDFAKDVFVASTHDNILFFTNRGIVHLLKVYQLPEGSRQSMGKAIVNLLQLTPGEQVSASIPVHSFTETDLIIMATRNGTIKKSALHEYMRPRRGGIIAITLEKEDELIAVQLTDNTKNILIATRNGRAVRFNEQDVRPTGRSAKGVGGIRLRENDAVIGMVAANEKQSLLTITSNGYGKRSLIEDYRFTNRGGKGVINIKISDKNGQVVGICAANDGDELLILSKNGQAIRVATQSISVIGRNTQGVRIMRLDQQDKVVALAKIQADNKI